MKGMKNTKLRAIEIITQDLFVHNCDCYNACSVAGYSMCCCHVRTVQVSNRQVM